VLKSEFASAQKVDDFPSANHMANSAQFSLRTSPKRFSAAAKMDHQWDICHQIMEISAAQKIGFLISNSKREAVPSLRFGFPLAN
jgi:hypothetical protein